MVRTDERVVELVSGQCVWYRGGKPPVPIRWVIVRDPQEEFEMQALLCTRIEAEPVQIVEWYVKRWQVEVTFEESRRHLGIETQRQWSDKAINRTTPCLFGLFSLITMMAKGLSEAGKLNVQETSWYWKEAATFSDAIGCVRQCLWEKQSFLHSVDEDEMVKIPRAYVETLMETLCFVT